MIKPTCQVDGAEMIKNIDYVTLPGGELMTCERWICPVVEIHAVALGIEYRKKLRKTD
jgi:hypothetical protein